MPSITRKRGETTVKPFVQELRDMRKAVDVCRDFERFCDGDKSERAKSAADELNALLGLLESNGEGK